MPLTKFYISWNDPPAAWASHLFETFISCAQFLRNPFPSLAHSHFPISTIFSNPERREDIPLKSGFGPWDGCSLLCKRLTYTIAVSCKISLRSLLAETKGKMGAGYFPPIGLQAASPCLILAYLCKLKKIGEVKVENREICIWRKKGAL